MSQNISASAVSETPESERMLCDELVRLVDAGISIIQIKTREPGRTLEILRKHITADPANAYREFDIVSGTRNNFSPANYSEHALAGTNNDAMKYVEAIGFIHRDLNSSDGILRQPDPKLLHCVYNVPIEMTNNNHLVLETLKLYYTVLPSTKACMIFITGEDSLKLPTGMVHVINAPTPTLPELENYLRATLERVADDYEGGLEIDDGQYTALARLGLGMTKDEFDNCVCLVIVDNPDSEVDTLTAEPFFEGIARGKTEIVKSSDILELYHPESIENVAGMAGLKDWVGARVNCFSDEAREFGIQPPKAVALVGVPGTGKSLAAKAISSVLGVPLLRLDFGKVFSKWVGDSESRMRSALNMVSSMGQLVLMVDEIDKGLGGIGQGGADSGTSSRVLGAFLTWMQDNDSGCLVVVTANRIDGLPPELFRKGRMDQVFSVGMPNAEERRAVLEVHLRRRGRSLEDFSESELSEFELVSDGYVPAEIEQAVKDALILAFNEDPGNPTLEMRHILSAMDSSVPMSQSHADQIARITEWAEKNAVPVNQPIRVRSETSPAVVRRDRAPRSRSNRILGGK
ncbi:TPA: AAA family ATPase [Pseudomonas aeruginosa]|nr:hypothetical protein FBPa45_0066 [Pseudomonas phage vB_PaeS_FBPa45]HBO9768546.1 AAA family ATPase [Pseudomonas aeruginosa]